MKNELDYFYIDSSYGGCQNWFLDYMMRLGGCAAVTACDSCIYLDLYQDTDRLYPYDLQNLTKRDYINFSKIMKPYLRPRWTGIDTLELYIEGFGAYLSDHNAALAMRPFYGTQPAPEAKKHVMHQIDSGFPIPCLILNHANSSLRDYVWHWFLLTGYEAIAHTFMVKAVTYGNWRWIDFDALWSTGYERKGGLILYS